MAEIQGPSGTRLKGIPALDDVVDVSFGATPDKAAHSIRVKLTQCRSFTLERFEKHSITDAGYLDRFGKAAALIASSKRGEQLKVVDDRQWRRESPNKVF